MTNIQDFISTISFDSERFISVKNFEGRFWISDHGRLISFNHNFKLIRSWIDSTGYYACTLRMKPVKFCTRIHVLVGEHFCTMEDKGVRMAWNHIDGNKLNNHYSNLEYITAKDNCKHARETGLCDVKGERHGMSKLTNDSALSIFTLKNTGKSSSEVGAMFNISRRQVSDIWRGAAWSHLTSHLL